jgi:hypothetical protein
MNFHVLILFFNFKIHFSDMSKKYSNKKFGLTKDKKIRATQKIIKKLTVSIYTPFLGFRKKNV